MPLYKEIIGTNIKNERIARNMSVDELAKMLNLSPTFIGLIERGQRGAKLDNLIKIADIFGISINDLIYEAPLKLANEVHEPTYRNSEDIKRAAIQSLLYDCNATELEFLIQTIKNLKELRSEGFDMGEYEL